MTLTKDRKPTPGYKLLSYKKQKTKKKKKQAPKIPEPPTKTNAPRNTGTRSKNKTTSGAKNVEVGTCQSPCYTFLGESKGKETIILLTPRERGLTERVERKRGREKKGLSGKSGVRTERVKEILPVFLEVGKGETGHYPRTHRTGEGEGSIKKKVKKGKGGDNEMLNLAIETYRKSFVQGGIVKPEKKKHSARTEGTRRGKRKKKTDKTQKNGSFRAKAKNSIKRIQRGRTLPVIIAETKNGKVLNPRRER